MQNDDDRAYYQQRAEQERRAANSPVDSARAVHADLAQRYAALALRMPIRKPDDDLR